MTSFDFNCQVKNVYLKEVRTAELSMCVNKQNKVIANASRFIVNVYDITIIFCFPLTTKQEA